MIFAAAFAGGLVLEALAPVALPAPPAATAAMFWVGVLLVAGGVCLTTYCLGEFLRLETGIMPDRPARRVVSSGPYAWSRNPMFVGFALIYTGASLIIPSIWPLLLLPATVAYTSSAVIRHEEAYMRERFGEEFDSYTARVNRWIGRR